MHVWFPIAILVIIVAAILWMSRQMRAELLFRWLPVPLWCYMLPMMAVTVGWLPRGSPIYRTLNDALLPVALGLLLLGIDLAAVLKTGWRALAATAIGSVSIILGAPLVAWLLRSHLPPEAWTGVGTLAATWTGGSMNLLALRMLVHTPEPIFASLIIVDAIVAYSWMALLVALASLQAPIDRWLRAIPLDQPTTHATPLTTSPDTLWKKVACVLCALVLALGSYLVAQHLPLTSLISSRGGWTVLLVTSIALATSCWPAVQQLGRSAPSVGYPCLYVVLAAVGAQANASALQAAPIWLIVGAGIALVHGVSMLVAGRMLRLPLGVLATASQANIGGVVSTPLVGAVYEHRLAPVGLLLAIGLNAIGTYLGICAAFLAKSILGTG